MKKFLSIILVLTLLSVPTYVFAQPSSGTNYNAVATICDTNSIQNNETTNGHDRVKISINQLNLSNKKLYLIGSLQSGEIFNIIATPKKASNKNNIVYFTPDKNQGDFNIINISYQDNPSNGIIYHDEYKNKSKNILKVYLQNKHNKKILILEIFNLQIQELNKLLYTDLKQDDNLQYWYTRVIKPEVSQKEIADNTFTLKSSAYTKERNNPAIHTLKYNIGGATVYHNMEVHRQIRYPSSFNGDNEKAFYTKILVAREWTRCYDIPSLNDENGSAIELRRCGIDIATSPYQVIEAVCVDGLIYRNAKINAKISFNTSMNLKNMITITFSYESSKAALDINKHDNLFDDTRQAGVVTDWDDIIRGGNHFIGQRWIISNTKPLSGQNYLKARFKYLVGFPLDETETETITTNEYTVTFDME
ncbi:hypothetical protein [Vallitalea maricola]|uniref:Uncharacterized protein n=1 Tax=Vallitalea maricola TaxID=3074433 RepID=A0ACB5UF77_9FIRM|nr:hypothetical protein AN2V17_07310 [Vallitalea sp. AN17-2]